MIIPKDDISHLAQPAHYSRGNALFGSGKVEVLERSRDKLKAKIWPAQEGGSTRTVEIYRTDDSPKWNCTCNNDSSHLCSHLVAAALADSQ